MLSCLDPWPLLSSGKFVDAAFRLNGVFLYVRVMGQRPPYLCVAEPHTRDGGDASARQPWIDGRRLLTRGRGMPLPVADAADAVAARGG
jgi:hypothetical protein